MLRRPLLDRFLADPAEHGVLRRSAGQLHGAQKPAGAILVERRAGGVQQRAQRLVGQPGVGRDLPSAWCCC